MLRAGPFSDDRIVRLANRRFVPFYFDLSNRGVAGDPAAREFVVTKRKELGGMGVPTPPVLFMTAEGEVVGEVSNYASSEQVLKEMLDLLKDYPEYDKPTAEEEALADPIAKAWLMFDLMRYDDAARLAKGIDSDDARYLLGHLARMRKDWKAMNAVFARIKAEDLTDDIRMERAYEFWAKADLANLQQALDEFPRQSNRYTEARYHLGLAQFHRGDKKAALATWKGTILACAQDPWIYRADWAFTGAQQKKGRRMFSSSAGNRVSCLNRIGYMGRSNPDLAPRK